MLRRLTVFLVVVSVLMYGTAWAFDAHWSEAGDHVHAIDHTDSGPLADDDDCDHCCHAGAHLLGLPLRSFAGPLRVPETFLPGYRFVAPSRPRDAPFKPPRC